MSGELTMVAMLAITAGASIYVAWPLLMGKTRPEDFLGTELQETALQHLMFQRDSTYAAMKELEFDLATGTLTQEDFQQLHERYKRKAVAILKRMDDVKAGRPSSRQVLADIDDNANLAHEARRPGRPSSRDSDLDVEQEIEAFRTRSRAKGGADAEPLDVAAAFCASCGHPVADEDAAYCARCGAALQKGKSRGASSQGRAEQQKAPRGQRRQQ